jgi:two-component system, NtrC family, sensor kinase
MNYVIRAMREDQTFSFQAQPLIAFRNCRKTSAKILKFWFADLFSPNGQQFRCLWSVTFHRYSDRFSMGTIEKSRSEIAPCSITLIISMSFTPELPISGSEQPATSVKPASPGKNTRNLVARFLLGGTALVVGMTAYFSYQVMRASTLENLKQKAFLKVDGGTQTIDQWIALRKSETASIANAPITQTMDWATIQPYFQSEYQRLNTFLPYLGIINPQGKFFNLLKGANNPSLQDRPHFKQGMAGESTVLDPIISRVTGRPIIVFASPVWSALAQDQDRKPIGVVNAPIGVEKITEVVQQLKYGEGSYAFALNSKGEAITHPDTTLMSTLEKPAPSLVQSADPNLAKIAQKMVNRQQGIELTSLNGIQKYVVYLPLKEVNWSVALVIPRHNIESQLKLLDGIAVIVLVLASTLIAVLIYIQTTEQTHLKRANLLAEAEVARTSAELQASQVQMVQSEKMSALGNLVAGVAHEINNPIACVIGNVEAIEQSIKDLFYIIDLYAQRLPKPDAELKQELEEIDLDYLREDLPKLLQSMQDGGDRVKSISKSLRAFSRADTDTKYSFNIHEGIDSTVLILRHRLKANTEHPEIQIIKNYGSLPNIQCFPGQLNQVFMNILANAIDALEESNQGRSFAAIVEQPNTITICTSVEEHGVRISIADNGPGIPESVKDRIFEQSFTTKAVGKGTGLGLAIAHQIVVEKHGGSLEVQSTAGQGTEFCLRLPMK